MAGRLQTFAIGCGALLLLVLLIVVSLYFWAVTPGPQVPTDFILGADSLALMHVEGLQQDPGLRAMIEKLLTEVQSVQARRARRADVPWFVRILAGRERMVREKDIDKTLRDMPRDLTITLEAVPGKDAPQVAVAVNLSRFPRVLRLVFSIASLYQNAEQFEGSRILSLGRNNEGVVTFVEQTALWAQTPDTVRQVLMRRAEVLEDAGGTRILEAYNNREKRWNLYGVIENRDGALAWLLSRASSNRDLRRSELIEELAPVTAVRFGIDVVDEDSLEARLDVECRSDAEADLMRIRVDEVLSSLLVETDLGDLRIEQEAQVSGNTVTWILRVGNIGAAVVRQVEKAG